MQRLLTAAVTVPLALAAVFYLPSEWFFILIAVVCGWAASEFSRIARFWAPGAPIEALVALVILAAVLLAGPDLIPLTGGEKSHDLRLFAGALLLSVGVGCLVLLAKTPLPETFTAFGACAFGVPYFALPTASLYHLHKMGAWWLILLFAIVWLGDTAAYYAGSRLGKNKLAPTVSPNKTWEGSVASFLTGILATVIWSWWQIGFVDGRLILVGAATAAAAQVGDLVESMIKRGAGVKDSGTLLPGHGGMLDRMDAMLFAAPVFLFGLWITGAYLFEVR
jgi:phosphatidate cytidylyltransferase